MATFISNHWGELSFMGMIVYSLTDAMSRKGNILDAKKSFGMGVVSVLALRTLRYQLFLNEEGMTERRDKQANQRSWFSFSVMGMVFHFVFIDNPDVSCVLNSFLLGNACAWASRGIISP
mmetsp:Transcript_13521/g.20917  ORF Transcript_13521/g.20917 Transcript_13521/m.20917 type:complete len:120 (-) Transcript_13521:80-439(-)